MEVKEETFVIVKELIKADVVDSNGHVFPREVLQAMAEAAQAQINNGVDLWVTEGFRESTSSIQGRLAEVNFADERNAVDAKVEVYPTPAGNDAAAVLLNQGVEALELAMCGEVQPNDAKRVDRDGRPVWEFQKVDLRGASLVAKGTKTK